MPITFYTAAVASPPARAVEIVIKILGLDVEKRVIDLMKKENYEPWFAELNPTCQVPVIDDDGYVLTDSHAIIAYLLTTYAPEEILEQYYPTDPKERGIIHSRWHFENGVLFARIKTILFPILLWSDKTVPLEKTRWLLEGVYFLERLLDGKKWLAGDRLTVADISTITTIDLAELLVPLKYYKNVSAWAKRTRKASPFYEECGVEQLKDFATHFKENDAYNAEDRWNEIQRDVNE